MKVVMAFANVLDEMSMVCKVSLANLKFQSFFSVKKTAKFYRTRRSFSTKFGWCQAPLEEALDLSDPIGFGNGLPLVTDSLVFALTEQTLGKNLGILLVALRILCSDDGSMHTRDT